MTEDPARWSQPFAALLGAYEAQLGFGLPSIGGKDSMSGTFEDIDVPPTLCSFAVDVAKESDIITPELKTAGNVLVRFDITKNEYDLPDYEQVMKLYGVLHELIGSGVITAAYALDGEPRALERSVFLQSLERILRAGRNEPAAGRLERRNVPAVKLHKGDEQTLHAPPSPSVSRPSLAQADKNAASS